MFMLDGGIFLCKLSRRFGHQFSQSDCFIVTSCWVWGIHTHLSLRGCLQSRLRIWFYKCFSKIISRPLPAIQTCRGSLYSGRWLNCQGKNWELNSPPTLLWGCVYQPRIDAVFTVLLVTKMFNCQQLSWGQTTCCSDQLWGRRAQRKRRQMTPLWPADIHAINSYNKSKWIRLIFFSKLTWKKPLSK